LNDTTIAGRILARTMVSSMPTAKTTAPRTRWISLRAVMRHGISRRNLTALVRGGFIKTHRLPIPGAWTRYDEADVLRLLPGSASSPSEGGPP
jgi:hypothetical protein